jgi:hypothetical protein
MALISNTLIFILEVLKSDLPGCKITTDMQLLLVINRAIGCMFQLNMLHILIYNHFKSRFTTLS